MFDYGDTDQQIIIDLGRERTLTRIGADFSTDDRKVWQFFGAEVSSDGKSWARFGLEWPGVASSPVFFANHSAGRYVTYYFGAHSPKEHRDGSGIHRLFESGP